MAAAKYVGRVGGLAVALGVGAAVATGHGVAWAESADGGSDTGSSSASSSSASSTPGGASASQSKSGSPGARQPSSGADDSSSTDRSETSSSEDPSGTGPDGDPSEPEATPDSSVEDDEGAATEQDYAEGEGEATQDTSSAVDDSLAEEEQSTSVGEPLNASYEAPPQHDSAPTRAVALADSSADSDGLAANRDTPASTADVEPPTATAPEVTHTRLTALAAVDDGDATTTVTPDAADVTVAPVAPPPAAPNSVEALIAIPGAVLQVASNLISAVLTPFLAPAGPAAPAQPPGLWAVLAWVRREIQHTFFNTSPTLAYNPADNVQNNLDVTVTGDLNPSDREGDSLSFTVTGAPQEGTVEVNADGTFSYVPDAALADAGGTDSFVVTVSDRGFHLHGLLGFFQPGGGHTTTATVEVTVDPVNSTPGVDITDVVTDPTTGTVTGRFAVVDVDGDGDADTTVVPGTTTSTKGGAVTVNVNVKDDGSFTYTPTDDIRHAAAVTEATDADTTDTFAVTYRYRGRSYLESVTVPVSPHNAAPSVESSVSTGDDGSTTITVTVTDEDGDAVRIVVNDPALGEITGLPEDRTIVVNPEDGSTVTLQYVPDADAEPGTDTVTLVIDDDHLGGQLTTTVTVTIGEPNTPPVITEVTTGTANSTTGAISGTVNVTDDDTVTYTVGTASHGEVSIDADGQFSYTPDLDYFGTQATGATDTFTVTVTDADGVTATRTLTYTWEPTTGLEASDSIDDLSDLPVVGWAVSPDGTTLYVSDGEAIYTPLGGLIHELRVFQIGVDAAGHPTYTEVEPIRVAGAMPPSGSYYIVDNTIALSPDGTRLYVQLFDGPVDGSGELPPVRVRAVDTTTGNFDRAINIPLDVMLGNMVVSPDGMLYGMDFKGTFQRIDLTSGEISTIEHLSRGYLNRIAISPDGGTLYTTAPDGIMVTDLESGDYRVLHGYFPSALAVSPDGTELYMTDEPYVDADQGAVEIIERFYVLDVASGGIVQTIDLQTIDDRYDAPQLLVTADGTVYATHESGTILSLTPVQVPSGTITA